MLNLTPNLYILLMLHPGAAESGALVGLLAIVTLLMGVFMRTPPLGIGEGTLTGLPTGLFIGIAGGAIFEYAQSLHGIVRFTLAGGFSVGVALGGILGWLLMLAIATVQETPRGLALGAIVGLVAGLVAFRLAFGAYAGFGPELDSGVGPEVGVLLGTVGLLLGALGSQMLGARSQQGFRWARVAWGALGGAGVGLLVALIGSQTGVAVFILPGVAPAYAMPGSDLAGVFYGLGVFALIGLLVGATAGAAALNGWGRALGLALSLGVGGFIGLSLGLGHADVGGPMYYERRQFFEPTGTRWGILIGLAAGLAVGALCWLALRWSKQRPRTHAVVVAVLLLALSVALIATPMWFRPLFGVDIP